VKRYQVIRTNQFKGVLYMGGREAGFPEGVRPSRHFKPLDEAPHKAGAAALNPDLMANSKKRLLALAQSLGLETGGKMNKAELIGLIKTAQGGEA
jgi:hypothetical protein